MATDDCLICRRQPDVLEPGGTLIYADEYWSVRHSQETNILGYLLAESRRHISDLSAASPAEAQTYGQILAAVHSALKVVLPCQRIYTFSLGEAVPHFHLHIIPRLSGLPRAYRGRGILSYPVSPAADSSLVEQVCEKMRKQMRLFKPDLPRSLRK